MTTFIKSHLISQSSSGIFHYNFEVISPLYLKLGLDSEKHINPKSLQYIMGHSDINITMNPYAENVNSKCEKNIKKYNQASRANSSRHSANTISAVFQPNISRG